VKRGVDKRAVAGIATPSSLGGCRKWAQGLSMRVAVREGGRRPWRRLSGAFFCYAVSPHHPTCLVTGSCACLMCIMPVLRPAPLFVSVFRSQHLSQLSSGALYSYAIALD
jgi:hypothetical protein